MLKRIPLTACVAAVVVTIGTCLSWGYAALPDEGNFGFGSKPEFVATTGWTSLTDFKGIPVPNFVPFLVAVALAVWTIRDRQADRSGVAGILITYGVIHGIAASLWSLRTREAGAFGIGPVLVLCAFLALIVTFAKADPKPDASPQAADSNLI